MKVLFRIKLIRESAISNRTKKVKSTERAFTLIELIVVAVIVGILTAISVPGFNNAAKKARQREAVVIVSGVVRAVQAYWTEYSVQPQNVGDLYQYVDLVECLYGDRQTCKNSNYYRNMGQTNTVTQRWNSTSGGYAIDISLSNNTRFLITAKPQSAPPGVAQSFLADEYGASGCFNYLSGAMKVDVTKDIGAVAVIAPRC